MTAPFIQLPAPPVMTATYGMDVFITPWLRQICSEPIPVQGDIGGGDISGAWPVGSVFISAVSTNPSTLLGFGTWGSFGAGRILVSRDAGDPDFDTAEATGGTKTHTHPGHSDHVVTQPANHVVTQPSSHVFTQPSGHSNHAFTQPSGHSNHVFTQPSGHSAHAAIAPHQHSLPLHGGSTPRITAGYGTGSSVAGTRSLTNAAQTTSQAVLLSSGVSGGTPDAHSAHAGGAVDAHSAHAGGAVDAHSAHAGGAVDAHSGTAVNAHSGAAVDAHSAHDSPNHMNPYIVVYMWKRTA